MEKAKEKKGHEPRNGLPFSLSPSDRELHLGCEIKLDDDYKCGPGPRL